MRSARAEDRRAHARRRRLRAGARAVQLPRRRERRSPGREAEADVWIARGLQEKSVRARRRRASSRSAFRDVRGPGTSRRSTSRTCVPGRRDVLGAREAAGRGDRGAREPRRPSRGRTRRPSARRRRASKTPTLATTRGRLAPLTTSTHPDRALYQRSVAQELAAHRPFVVVFATPKFCTSRTCGPVVDVVSHVRKQLARRGVDFIHVEVYERQRPGARLQPLDARVGLAERAVDLPRRPRRADQGEVRGLGVRRRAALRGRVAARGIRPHGGG